jgi:phosphatidylserine/phosphatidylglycerophosphate/cardiolipin synthase-like enzyme
VKRGVQVQFLFGNVRPRFGDDVAFPGGSLRELADELVRSRLEPLIRAGAEGYEFAMSHPTLGRVFPHVHAKLYTRDEDLVAIGSANVDVTSAYWESEALVLVHDEAFARATIATLDGLLAQSRRVDLQAQSWALTESRRDWLGRNWPSLMG